MRLSKLNTFYVKNFKGLHSTDCKSGLYIWRIRGKELKNKEGLMSSEGKGFFLEME